MTRSFASTEEELAYWRSHAQELDQTLSETRAALDEFQQSSRELEEELEKELDSTERAYRDLKSKNETLRREAEEWKTKYQTAKHDQNISMMQMQREIDVLKATESTFRKKTLELELDNDDLERTERAAQSSLADLELKYNRTIERNVILENEIAQKDELAEQVQRLKDELRDTFQELSVQRDKYAAQETQLKDTITKLTTAERSLWRAQTVSPQPPLTPRSTSPDRESLSNVPPRSPSRLSRLRAPSSYSGANTVTGPHSNPVKMVQDMVGRVKTLEARLQSCRILVTPLLQTSSQTASGQFTISTSPTRPSPPPSTSILKRTSGILTSDNHPGGYPD